MKPHFSKLLTEKERAGSSLPSEKWSKRLKYDPYSDYEKELNRVPMSRTSWINAAGWDEQKALTDVLSPLKGYLRKNIGKHWDKVWSELCSNLDRRSVTGRHVFEHLFQYVSVKCWQDEDGKIYELGRVGYGGDHKTPISDYYVHPKTGILYKRVEYESNRSYRKRQKAEEPITKLNWPDGSYAEPIEGVWYFFKIYYEDVYVPAMKRYDGSIRAAYHKQEARFEKLQLNKKELKTLGVQNVPR